jgi:hypothetical protein
MVHGHLPCWGVQKGGKHRRLECNLVDEGSHSHALKNGDARKLPGAGRRTNPAAIRIRTKEIISEKRAVSPSRRRSKCSRTRRREWDRFVREVKKSHSTGSKTPNSDRVFPTVFSLRFRLIWNNLSIAFVSHLVHRNLFCK